MNAILVIAYVALIIMNGFLGGRYISIGNYVAGGLHIACAVIWAATFVIQMIS